MNKIDNIEQIPEVCLRLLKSKGLVDKEQIAKFLFPKLKDLKQPTEMKGLTEATALITHYIENDLQIVIWGDYDVDGTTATGLLVNFFKELGIEVKYHIPNRLTEGYGLNVNWFEGAISDFSSRHYLLITVDCGISNHREVEAIKALGGDVIITDHHSIPPNGLPDCVVINPSQLDCGFNIDKLAGVGVSFYLAAKLRAELLQSPKMSKIAQSVNLKQYLGFVALGTIADLVEITPTNRILVRAGLEALKSTKFPGLNGLLDSCGLYDEEISTEDIGFLIGPKINAAGRLGKSDVAIKLFLAETETEARKGADTLEKLNQKRKTICENDLETALSHTSRQIVEDRFCSICSGEYHLGVAGIVASRLVEEFKVPAIVFAECKGENGEEILKGSIRSVEGVSVIRALNECSEDIERYGGHDMAAGLTVKKESLEIFSAHFSQNLKEQIATQEKRRRIDVITETSVDHVMATGTLEFLSKFEPYGPGNATPVFRDRDTTIVQAKTVGRLNSHLNLIVRGEYSNYKGIGFNLGDRISIVQENPERTICFVPTKNRYRGTVSWQLRIVDLK